MRSSKFDKGQHLVKIDLDQLPNYIRSNPDKYKEYRSPINTCLKLKDSSNYKKIS